MVASKADLYIEQGATFAFEATCADTAEPPNIVDITGTSIAMQIRQKQKSPVLVEASTSNGKITLTNPANGKFRVELASTDTNLLSVRKALYDIEVTFSTTHVERVLEGAVTVSPNITQLESDPVVTE